MTAVLLALELVVVVKLGQGKVEKQSTTTVTRALEVVRVVGRVESLVTRFIDVVVVAAVVVLPGKH